MGTGAITDLRYCDGSNDWFELTLPPGRGALATILFAPKVDLSPRLYGSEFALRRSSDGRGGSERVSIAADMPRPIIEVAALLGTTADYRLSIELLPP